MCIIAIRRAIRSQIDAYLEDTISERAFLDAFYLTLTYYRQQNLTRKIWDAQICAETMNRYTSRTGAAVELYQGLQDVNQKDEAKKVPSGWGKEWSTALRYSDPSQMVPVTKVDEKMKWGEFFTKHNDPSDKYYQAIRRGANIIAGTKDALKDFGRSYFPFANWPALESLSDKEFESMMDCFTAFNVIVDEKTSPKVIAKLRETELQGLRLYKKVLLNELPSLQEKYGIGLLLENPLYFINHHERDIRNDVGNEQTIASALDVFKKYGILDVNDPADQDLFLTMNYIYASHTAAVTARNTLSATIRRTEKGTTYPSYADLMKQYEIYYHTTLSGSIPASDLLRIRELEKKLENHPRIMWEKKLHYTAPAS